MNKTYEEILDSMKSAYFNECGDVVEDNSETLKRFEILASELFSLSCYNDYIFKQAFVQTASGDHLDMLGELRACKRKTPAKSKGELCFSIAEPSENDIEIPAGTVCSVLNKPYHQFATKQQTIIPAGELEARVEAESLSTGADFNARANTITVMVNAPVGVSSVTNEYEFLGGYSLEDDDTYRARILSCFEHDQNGVSLYSYQNRVMALDYVTDCKIIPADFGIGMIIYVATKTNTLSFEDQYEIALQIPFLQATGISYEIKLAQKDSFDLTVNIGVKSGFEQINIINSIEDTIKNRLSSIGIGKNVYTSDLKALINEIDGVDSCELYCARMFDGIISPDEGKQLSLGRLEVNVIYG